MKAKESSTEAGQELDAIRERYQRRNLQAPDQRYSFLNPAVWQTVHERQRAFLRLLSRLGWLDLREKRLIEVGCGSGGNLLELLRFGFDVSNLQGIELLEERYAEARRALPMELKLVQGDACELDVPPESQDIVFQSTVFSSLLDDTFQQRLADAMWGWVKPGGGVLWYDFTFNNPRNADVRGVSLRRVRELFPSAQVSAQRVTLAPPIARRVVQVHPCLYSLFNTVPLLRTHVLAWISKPSY
ncbi:class I SAM-dependent methyltransferase [Variovorax sp. V59]|uniref:class I SAM-dependent methyltransferase n=1 Tax=unclassified Variovorax TaxID=663243 RepID=UPI0034E9371D